MYNLYVEYVIFVVEITSDCNHAKTLNYDTLMHDNIHLKYLRTCTSSQIHNQIRMQELWINFLLGAQFIFINVIF